MEDWWSYRLGSFLLFSQATYQRLLSAYNADGWPLQWLAPGWLLSLLLPWLLPRLLQALLPGLLPISSTQPAAVARSRASRLRTLLAQAASSPWLPGCLWFTVAAAWAWSAWAFLVQRFMAINWAAEYLAWAMGLQVIALCIAAASPGRMALGRVPPARPALPTTDASLDPWGLGLVCAGLLAYPLISAHWGQDWSQAHGFGMLPEPTAVTTLGLLLLARRPAWWLWPLPVLVCLWSGLWLWALAAPAAWLAPAAAALALGRVCLLHWRWPLHQR